MKIFSSPYYCDEKSNRKCLNLQIFLQKLQRSPQICLRKVGPQKKEETQAQETQKAQIFR